MAVSSSSVNQDRRQSRRAPFVAAVRTERGGHSVELALARNLGEDGMEIRRPPGSDFGPGARVSLAFELPDGGHLIELSGAVVSERAEGRFRHAGIRFEGVTPIDRARIARYLDAQLA